MSIRDGCHFLQDVRPKAPFFLSASRNNCAQNTYSGPAATGTRMERLGQIYVIYMELAEGAIFVRGRCWDRRKRTKRADRRAQRN